MLNYQRVCNPPIFVGKKSINIQYNILINLYKSHIFHYINHAMPCRLGERESWNKGSSPRPKICPMEACPSDKNMVSIMFYQPKTVGWLGLTNQQKLQSKNRNFISTGG